MREIEKCENRLKSIIVLDKQEVPKKLDKLIKAEMLYLLRNYFDICAEDLELNINVNDFGKYVLEIRGECKDMKIAYIFS